MRTMMTLLGAAALLVGCGEAKQGFDDGFNTKFHESFVTSCVKSATQSGAEQAVADKVCACASDKIKERYSVKEKMSLKTEQILPLVQACRGSSG